METIVKKLKAEKKMRRQRGLYERYIKRILDFVCALSGLIILSPVFLLLIVLVRIWLGSPVIFRQARPGLYGHIFTLYKFRTMTDEKDTAGRLLPDEDRLTGFGKWLRSTSLDELPELVNVLKGEMSIVGPRPLLVQYLPLYNEHQNKRHDVRPGITGYAQVNGRNAVRWERKFDMDVWYTEHVGFRLDWRIIFSTFRTVSARDGISSSTSVTMESFQGEHKE